MLISQIDAALTKTSSASICLRAVAGNFEGAASAQATDACRAALACSTPFELRERLLV